MVACGDGDHGVAEGGVGGGLREEDAVGVVVVVVEEDAVGGDALFN